jgi:hypothetical protein
VSLAVDGCPAAMDLCRAMAASSAAITNTQLPGANGWRCAPCRYFTKHVLDALPTHE